jgi:hypothetical protein
MGCRCHVRPLDNTPGTAPDPAIESTCPLKLRRTSCTDHPIVARYCRDGTPGLFRRPAEQQFCLMLRNPKPPTECQRACCAFYVRWTSHDPCRASQADKAEIDGSHFMGEYEISALEVQSQQQARQTQPPPKPAVQPQPRSSGRTWIVTSTLQHAEDIENTGNGSPENIFLSIRRCIPTDRGA